MEQVLYVDILEIIFGFHLYKMGFFCHNFKVYILRNTQVQCNLRR